jgi:hypothetical protein
MIRKQRRRLLFPAVVCLILHGLRIRAGDGKHNRRVTMGAPSAASDGRFVGSTPKRWIRASSYGWNQPKASRTREVMSNIGASSPRGPWAHSIIGSWSGSGVIMAEDFPRTGRRRDPTSRGGTAAASRRSPGAHSSCLEPLASPRSGCRPGTGESSASLARMVLICTIVVRIFFCQAVKETVTAALLWRVPGFTTRGREDTCMNAYC